MEKEINYDTKVAQSEKFVGNEQARVIIPQCCREGWENCPHRVQRAKKVKRNVGM